MMPEESLSAKIEKAAGQVPVTISRAVYEQLELLAASIVAPGLDVGERAPDFTLPDRSGEQVTLSRLLAQGPVVLSFLRGSWCPICTLETEALEQAYPEFRSMGAELLGVSPQAAERQRFGGEDGLSYKVLVDAEQRVIKDYKLHFAYPQRLRDIYLDHFKLDVGAENADGSWALPVPATFIINRDGRIYSRFVEMNYLRRMDPLDILIVLKYMK